ncbi:MULTISPECIES: LPS assembly lipoprotein LptE [Vitreoscilla]|uniref:LPS-assembly lipoprotein LptE n=1 Tax=Vitreoscilla stercoraria TaxID=61 RepID=A0ABY4E7F3_VITST|nr:MULTISPECIES: LPS assembly lipoprotein LptE [Vitreoscilla]AUZ04594.2 hypothetical protein ADP71_08560 [Vitreoscilla sp. C1]UOO91706.1 LPS assembly lipoprotein LptE [Vitreoscilla stercoraria]
MKKWLILSCLFLLSACGFNLRGVELTDTLLPYHRWAVEDAKGMYNPIKYELKRRQDVEVVDAAQSQAILRVLEESTDRRSQSLNLEGSTTEYLMTLNVTIRIEQGGMIVSEPMSVQVRRFMKYSDNEILSKDDEEQKLWQDMRREAAAQLILRIAMVNAADLRVRQ